MKERGGSFILVFFQTWVSTLGNRIPCFVQTGEPCLDESGDPDSDSRNANPHVREETKDGVSPNADSLRKEEMKEDVFKKLRVDI